MSADWAIVSLSEIAAIESAFSMGPFGSDIKADNYRSFGIPVLRGVNITKGATPFIDTDYVYLEESKAHELKRSSACPGDLLFVAQGTVGKIGRIPENSKHKWFILSQNMMRARVDSRKADSRFLYYYFTSHEGQSEIMSYVNPTGVPCVSQPLTSLKKFQVPLPPLPEQRAIAHILGTLDDKIELNRKMNETLEAMARALFKSWFVDFGPVRRNMARRGVSTPLNDPASVPERSRGAEIDALFPGEFEDSALGEVPKGWRVGKIEEIIQRMPVGKKYDQKSASQTGKVPILDQGRSGLIGYHNDEPSFIASPENPVIVFANHTCYMRLISYPFSAIQNVLPFVGKDKDILWVFYATVDRQSFIEYKGHWPDFILHQLAIPNNRLDLEFGRLIRPWYHKTISIAAETRALAQIRDTLLPKLISGELRVRDASKFVEAAL